MSAAAKLLVDPLVQSFALRTFVALAGGVIELLEGDVVTRWTRASLDWKMARKERGGGEDSQDRVRPISFRCRSGAAPAAGALRTFAAAAQSEEGRDPGAPAFGPAPSLAALPGSSGRPRLGRR